MMDVESKLDDRDLLVVDKHKLASLVEVANVFDDIYTHNHYIHKPHGLYEYLQQVHLE